jgi:hypothetical protein
MKARSIGQADLLLLRDFLMPGSECCIEEAKAKKKNFTVSYYKVIPHDFGGLIFKSKKGQLTIRSTESVDARLIRFDYINNPDGTMRWIFPVDGSPEPHLALYNSNTRKAGIYRKLTRLVWKAGGSGLLSSGTLWLQQNLLETVKKQYGIRPDETFSLFTGTRGATRKIVISVYHGGQVKGFIKVPLTPLAFEGVENENEMVKELGKYDLTTLSLPRISQRINGHARLSNIRPAVCIPAERITAIHIRALAELYALSHERRAIADTAAWESITNNMEWLSRELVCINELNHNQVKTLISLLRRVYGEVNAGESVAVSVSHGDFTPWNMYCDEQRLYVYDWEMARNGIPMCFDLFHFSYQSTILQQQKDYTHVTQAINLWTRQALTQQLVKKYKINLQLHHTLYLLFTVSHYLRRYLCEKELLMQSQWMMDAWTLAMNDCLFQIQNKAART